MKMLSAEELAELRAEVAASGYSQSDLDDLIRFVDSIVISFIDQEFGWNSVQNTLSFHANYAFKGTNSCGNLGFSGIAGPVELASEGAVNTIGPEGQIAP